MIYLFFYAPAFRSSGDLLSHDMEVMTRRMPIFGRIKCQIRELDLFLPADILTYSDHKLIPFATIAKTTQTV